MRNKVLVIAFASILLLTGDVTVTAQQSHRNSPAAATITLDQTVAPSPFQMIGPDGSVRIVGTVPGAPVDRVRVRVTTSNGETSTLTVKPSHGLFSCRYPLSFKKPVAPLRPCLLFIDATTDTNFNVAQSVHNQAEATLIVLAKSAPAPQLPVGFTDCLRDAAGRTDARSAQWSTQRTLVNLFEHSMAAYLMHADHPDFDLAHAEDLLYFKKNLSLYGFATRDRDWAHPLGQRPRRTYWNSVWRTWFNSSNDNPIDLDPKNQDPSNYNPYVFSNDFSDTLIMYLMQRRESGLSTEMCREGVENLLAMQYTGQGNFALKDTQGRQETYTAGAFRYGMFENGAYMTEGNGWFYIPAFRDYAAGGVLNGRCIWALGESLYRDPHGPLRDKTLMAVSLGAQFCLVDGKKGGYTHTTPQGHTYWRDASEHAYLLLGLLSACRVAPGIQFGDPVRSLKDVCAESVNALVDLETSDQGWSVYPNDAMCIAALAEGIDTLKGHPDVPRWKKALSETVDRWTNLRLNPTEYSGDPVHFGIRIGPDTMSYNWHHLGADIADRNVIYLYHSGHWIHALSRAYAVTGNDAYRQRAEKMISYLCGANPWHVRLFNELGAVYNWVEDTDGDGIEDYLKQDMYPESTAFCQIGILHYLHDVYHCQ